MLTLPEMWDILRYITYKDWTIQLKVDGDRPFLQVIFLDEDISTGRIEEQKARKWFLSPHMTASEVVGTAFLAVKTAEEHETREQFKYKGRAVFGPHFSVEALVEFSRRKENLDMRTGEWVRQE